MLDPLLAGPQVQPFQIFSTWGDYIYSIYPVNATNDIKIVPAFLDFPRENPFKV